MVHVFPKDTTESQSAEYSELQVRELLCGLVQTMRIAGWVAERNALHVVLNTWQPSGSPKPRPCAQRAGTTPRTVEVGMVLCRPAEGTCASAWRVEDVTPGLTTALISDVSHRRRMDVATAALVHEAGGWVLAADWTQPGADEVAR